jgi:hypothetical protein
MTNEEAIEIIKIAIAEVEWEYPMGFAAAFEVAIKALKEQARWIPVSERLPKETGRLNGYLVSIGDWVGFATFVDGKFWNNYFRKSLFDFPVEAWMPMPMPYKKEDK